MSHLNPIFAVWDDNAEALAADIGEKGVTVRQWRNRGDIPSRAAQLKIIRAAFDKNGTVFRLEDFLSPEERRELPDAGASDHGASDTAADRNASATKADGIIGDGGASSDLANNRQENICDAGGEGGHRTPFSVTEAATAASSPTCSTTIEQSASPRANPASSSTPEVKAA